MFATIAFALAALGAAHAAPAGIHSCAELTQGLLGAPCHLNFGKYREADDALSRIEQSGFKTSAGGSTFKVSTPQEFNEATARLSPGDKIVLRAGTWRDADLLIHGEGTADQPIEIMADARGTILTGTSTLRVWGHHIVVYGLQFRDGTPSGPNFTVVQFGNGVGRSCDACIADRLTIDNYNSAPSDQQSVKVFYLRLQGADITVANSSFENQQNVGTMLHADHPAAHECSPDEVQGGGCFHRLLLLNNVFDGFSQGRRVKSDLGKDKMVEIGSGQIAADPGYSVIEGNTFEHADGGTNTVSIKESDVIIRGNVFRDNLGTLNLRSANRVLVAENLFDGTNRPGMGGVLVQGADHWVIRNMFQNLRQPLNDYFQPIALTMASHPDLENNQKDYSQVRDVVIADNTFVGCGKHPVVAGIMPTSARQLAPTSLFFRNNQVDGHSTEDLLRAPDKNANSDLPSVQ